VPTHAVASSTLTTITYDSRQEVLQLQFRDGSLYSYAGIPKAIYDALLRAPSKGQYFNSKIRGQFAHQRSGDAGSTRRPPPAWDGILRADWKLLEIGANWAD
jgi:hypothetical protein